MKKPDACFENKKIKELKQHPNRVPYLLYSDDKGNIFEDRELQTSGRSGSGFYRLHPDDFIELPPGSDLFHLPDRRPIGVLKNGDFVEYTDGWAIAAFITPGHTQLYLAAYVRRQDAPILPLYSYTCVGWYRGRYYTTAVQVDTDVRHDPGQFDHGLVEKKVRQRLARSPNNRLLQHIGDNCALTYLCPNARNYFLGRWECPLPISSACNANCLGCISHQPQHRSFPSTQHRLKFIPTLEEILEIAVPHLERAPRAIVSFGQGCEGEPLLVWELIRDAILAIRRKTQRGIINLNTNGSRPEVVEALCQSGLDSIRVSANSVQPEIYARYYLPNNYSFEHVKESLTIARYHQKWASMNYFTFPGFTDSQSEYEALCEFIQKTDISMIQWRNFNIDPDWYLEQIGITNVVPAIGVKQLMDKIHQKFPNLVFGYFNPYTT